ncbi:UNVERIFIED_CONTAM: hypothetical protein HDU68_002505, partial [Siphonaria sp. JEL0065]
MFHQNPSIYWRFVESTCLGSICIAATEKGVVFLTAVPSPDKSKYFEDSETQKDIPTALQNTLKQWKLDSSCLIEANAPQDSLILYTVSKRINGFTKSVALGEHSTKNILFGLPIDWEFLESHASPLKVAVWRVLTTIECGSVWDYSRVAKESGHPTAVRAVASAIGSNFVPLIIPCHRVLRKDGSLGGFSFPGGLDVKRKLLKMETGKLARGNLRRAYHHYIGAIRQIADHMLTNTQFSALEGVDTPDTRTKCKNQVTGKPFDSERLFGLAHL